MSESLLQNNQLNRFDPADQASADYTRMAQAIHFLWRHRQQQPSLRAAAESVNLGEHHFQRIFSQWAGISPKRFLQYLTKEQLKAGLRRGASVFDSALDTGLSGSGRAHDLLLQTEGVTPGEYKSGGRGVDIFYAELPSVYGPCLAAATERGLCFLAFLDGASDPAMQRLRREWPAANLYQDQTRISTELGVILNHQLGGGSPLRLVLRGTNFQIKVWEALLRVPPGALICYQDLAAAIGQPQASRAVGSAVAANPIALLIPCHRVIRKVAEIGDYHWGQPRKLAIIGRELAEQAVAVATPGVEGADGG